MSLLIFLLALSVLVIIHELGHYLAARMFGVKAEEFGFGFPPRLAGFVKEGKRWKWVSSRDRKEYANTVWSINWLPLGGFVRIKGETEQGIKDKDSIHEKPIWQRIIIIAAGVIMNWILAAALLTAVFALGTPSFVDEAPAGARIQNQSVMITQVLENSPAAKAGIEPGDDLVSVGGTKIATAADARTAISAQGTKKTEIILLRDKEQKTVSVTPEVLAELKKPGIGVALGDIGTVSFPLPQAAYHGVRMTASVTAQIVISLYEVLRDIFVKQEVSADLSGPVGIAVMANKIAKQGMTPFLQFAALLSVNLAVINFLPIPALDGGRVLFLILEKIRRRPMGRRLEIGIHNVAFLILIMLILLVTVRDVSRYGGVIVGGIRGVVGL